MSCSTRQHSDSGEPQTCNYLIYKLDHCAPRYQSMSADEKAEDFVLNGRKRAKMAVQGSYRQVCV